ncbi:IclR family transcriptional regulator [Alicyclobacillus cycloheptanicus]|uniref:DNA-binding IclR family transcriptional regulator n=1 Tax=Alicyclobacillus cycloheptanicus TaxID=1457 RepID=A0ABT9XIB2_9BACL|nr:DNA-binding IclR family transcriptional regulator [Alicyclobacillus cycloheptanicus]
MARNEVVVKSMNILKLFEQHEALSLNDIVNLTGSPKTSVMRMIRSLEDMEFISKRADKKYCLGLSFLHFGQLVAERLDIRRIALPYMIELRDEVDEAVALVVPHGDEAMYVEKVDTSQMVRVYTRVGRRAPYYAGACPRILLAFMEPSRREAYIESVQMVKMAAGTITDKAVLRQVLEESRKNGYSMSFSELETGAAAIAAPIFNHQGTVVGGLSILATDYRIREYQEQGGDLANRVKQKANQVSKELGWMPRD